MQLMSGRWVCRRCYESNDRDATACARCGLERGADPQQAAAIPDATAPAPQPWAAPTKPAGRPVWLSLVLRFAWIGVVIVVAVVGLLLNARRDDAGQISDAGTLGVQDLRVGDCFTLKDEGAEQFQDVDAAPCTKAHRYELFHIGNMDQGAYPGDAAVEQWVGVNCIPAFESYVNTKVEATSLNISWYVPTEEGWNGGDNSVRCAVFDPNNASITGSLKSSGR